METWIACSMYLLAGTMLGVMIGAVLWLPELQASRWLNDQYRGLSDARGAKRDARFV